MNKLGGYMAVGGGFGMVSSIITQNMQGGIVYGMAAGLMLVFILKRLSKR